MVGTVLLSCEMNNNINSFYMKKFYTAVVNRTAFTSGNFQSNKYFMRKLYVLIVLLCSGWMSVSAQVTVTGCTGAGNGSYATLAAATAAIVAAQPAANVVITITGNTTETGTGATLVAGTWTTLTIQPSGGAWTISGAITAGNPLLTLNGSDNVTINGLNTGGNALTISNTTASATSGTSTIKFIGGATNNTITNCSILGSGSMGVATNGGNFWFSTDANTANGNDNNTISNNNIGPAGANLPTKGIYDNGSTSTTAIGNSGNTITNNNIFDYFGAAVSSAGIYFSTGNTDNNVTNNRFYQTATRTQTTSSQHSAVWIANSSGNNYSVTGNTVGYASSSATGTYTLVGISGTVFVPFFINVGTTTASSFQGNIITAIAMSGAMSGNTSTTAPLRFFFVSDGLVNIGNVTGNTIGSLTATNAITYTSSSATASGIYGAYNFGSYNFNFSNNNIGGITLANTGGGASSFYGVRVNTLSTVAFTCTGNTIGGTIANSINATSTSTALVVNAILNESPAATITGNTIRNITAAGGTGTGSGSSIVGISTSGATSANHTVSTNTIFALNNTSAAGAVFVTGIFFASSSGTNLISRNFIHSLGIVSSAAAATVNGIYANSGTATYQNNMIRLGIDNAGASLASGIVINGITEVGGTNNFHHNSIYVGGSGVSGAVNTFAFQSTSTSTRSFRNNIFVNARSNGSGTGKHYAVKVAGTVPNPSGLTINNNDYLASGTGGVFGFFNSLDVASLANWKTNVGQDANSFNSDPQFISPAAATPDLHINAAIATAVEGNGAAVTPAVTDDYDGQARSGLTPIDIGADAGNFTSAGDVTAPAITYTTLTGTCLTSNRTITATITDGGGIPTTGSLVPRIYYRKGAGTWFSQAGTLASGSGTSGTWDFTIVNSDMSGVTGGDVISYYIIAQDNAGNIAFNPSTGSPAATNVNTVTTPPTANSYNIFYSLSGNYNVGTGQTFTTLTAAVAAYNTACLTGNVTFTLTDATYSGSETFPITINANATAGASARLTIKPATTATITGSSAVTILKLNGADYITIDGSNNGSTSRDLTISNTNTGTSSAIIWLASTLTDGATNNTIKNVIAPGNAPLTTFGNIISSGSVVGGTAEVANTNNIYDNNLLTASQSGITIVGASLDGGNVVTNNTIGSTVAGAKIGFQGMFIAQLSGVNISNNTILGIAASANSQIAGIYIGGTMSGGVVSSNKISDIKNSIAAGRQALGIWLASASTGIGMTVQNNMIWDIANTGASATPSRGGHGIGITAGGGYNIYHNSVALTTDASAATGINAAMYIGTGVTSLDIRNNIFVNRQTIGSKYTIYSESANTAFTNINNNDYFSLTGTSLGFIGSARNTLTDIQTGFGGNGASVNQDPLFVSTTDLHAQLASPINNLGTNVGVTLDIDGDTRSTTVPDMGADEFAGTAADVNPPTITYTNIVSDCVPGAHTLTATITDASGVPTSGGGLPVAYFRINAGAYSGVTGVSIGSNQYTFSIGTGAVAGDVVSYYVVAQDGAATPNVSVNPSAGAAGLSANPPTAATPPTTPSTFTIQPTLSGTYTVGTGQTYTTLGAAAIAYNTSCISGPVVFNIVTNTTEAGAVVFNANATASAVNTLIIKPASAGITVTGSTTAALVKLNGADYVTIDGSFNGSTSKDLTFENTNTGTSSAVIWIGSTATDGATNNTVKNVIAKGNAPLTTFAGIIAGSGVTIGNAAETANTNTAIQNNTTIKAQYGIVVAGNAAGQTGLIINGNTVGSATASDYIGYRGIFISNANNAQVNKNNIFNISTSAGNPTGLFVSGNVTNTVFDGNRIDNIAHNSTSGYGGKGIDINTGIAVSNLTFSNNMVSGIGGDGWNGLTGDAIVGIRIGATGGSTTTTGGIKLYFNSVSLTGSFAGNASGSVSAALYISSTATNIDLRNNILHTTLDNTALTTDKTWAIYANGTNAAFTNINYNDYFVSGAAGVLGYIGSDRTTLAAIVTGFGQNANSINVSPNFISTSNLHLLSAGNNSLNAAAVNSTGITTDFDNDTRDASTPDIGADEFTPCTPTPLAGIAVTPSASICAGESVTLTENGGTATSWTWSNGPTTQAISVSPASTTTYTVTATTSAGCFATASQTIIVNPKPGPVTVTPSSAALCGNGVQQLVASGGVAVTNVLSQDFNSGLGAWSIINGSGHTAGTEWQIITPPYTYSTLLTAFNGFDGSKFVAANSDVAGSSLNTTLTRLTSPVFSTAGLSAATLTFKHYHRTLGDEAFTGIEYSTNGGVLWTAVTGATYTNTASTGASTNPPTLTNVSLALPAGMLGQASIQIRFRYDATWDYYWGIDDVAITSSSNSTFTWAPTTDLYTDAGATVPYTGTATSTVWTKPTANRTYTVTATSPSNCINNATTVAVIVNDLALTATHTDVLCFGANTGTITASATGGTTPYQYALNGGPYQVSPNFTGLTAGTYIVHVKDNNGAGCEATTTVTIAQPASAVSVSTTSVVNPVCNNGTTGSFTAVGAGGTAGYTYSLDNVTYQGTGVFTGLSGGVPYTVYAKDANGCVGFTNITLTNPPLITVGASNNGPVCEGGSLTLTATGGTSYVWSGPNSFSSTANPAIINPASLAAAGLYSVTVTDGNGCSNTATTNVVINPTVVVGATLIAQGGTNVCSGTTVTFEATATGGGTTPNYEFFVGGVSMQNGTSNTYSHVIAANESVYVIVTSNATCAGAPATSNTVNMVVTTSVAASVTIAADGNPVCAGTPVTFTATGIGTGASPTYNFFVNGGSVQNSASNTYTYTPTNGNTVYVIMTSSSGCATGSPATSSTISMTVNPIPTTPTIGASGPLTFCTGGSVTLTSSYAGAGNTWSTGATTSSIVVTTGGTYNVTYFDGNCNSLVSADVIVTVNPIPAAPVITAGGPTTFCTGGSVTLTSDIATGNTWSTGQTTQSITVTTPGTYTVFQTVNGCPSANSNSIVVTVNPTPTVTASASCPSVFVGGSTTITASTSGSPTYQWYSNTTNSNVGGTLIPLATSATYNPPTGSAGTFYYYVQATVTGCPGLSAAVQIDVTNGPLNGTYSIGGAAGCTGFPTIAAATNYLNTNGLNGPVIFNVAASYSETTPAGGFVIGGTGSAIVAAGAFPTSSANTVTFNGNNAVITAAGNQTSGSLTDAIFKLVGADYITLQNFTMQENAANATTAAASNNMTEFGVALLYATTTDGAQNNTIANNNISLNRTYTNTYGIYSSTRHSAAATITTPALAEVTSAAGSNSFNKVYTNAISNVNVGISFIGAGTTIAAIDNGNDIGGSSSATGNTITNWGGAVGATAYPSTIAANYAILANQQINDNISYNNITSAALTSAASTGGILKIYSVASPTSGTITSNINNNTVTVTNNPTASTTGGVVGINNQGLTPLLSTATVNMNNNTVTGCRVGGTTSTTNGITGITNLSLPGTINITGNTVTNHAITATTATSGSLIGISNSGAAGTVNITNNTFTAFASTATSGQTAAISNSGAAVTAINLNNNFIGTTGTGYFSSTVASSGTLFGISNSGGAATSALSIQNNDIRGISYSVAASAAQTYHVNTAATLSQNISNNTFTNLTVNTTGNATFISNSVTVSATGTQTISNNRIITGYTKGGAGGAVVFITSGASSTSGATINWSNNIISNVTISGATTATFLSNVDGGSANKNFTGNTISNITGGTGTIIGISNSFGGGGGGLGNVVSGNTISGITSAGTITGINIGASGTANTVFGNTVSGFTGSGTGAVTGITSGSPTSGTFYNNKIYDLANNNAGGSVIGFAVTGGTLHNVYNNIIGNLTAPNLSATNGLIGMNFTGGTTINASFNTTMLNATSVGTNFGSSALSAATAVSLTLRNNIFVNNSVPNGTGIAVAYRRSSTTLTSYQAASNTNLFYAGATPSATRAIYTDGTNTDQTLAAFKTRMATRDQLSVTENPPFLSTTGANANFLHISTVVATQIESGGVPVTGITDDYDADTRSSTPDIGADEFIGIPIDNNPPIISYTPLGGSCTFGTNQVLTATISDASGVPTTGIGLPVLYFRVNAGAYTAVQGVSIGSNQYTFTFGNTTTAAGDVVSYYVVAQDNAGTPNVGAFPSAGAAGFTANPPAAATPPTTPSSYTVTGTLNGTYTVGVGQAYTTLTAAVADYNSKCLSGAVIFSLTDATYPSETFPIAINNNTYANSTNTLTIKPATGVTPLITGSNATAIIHVNGGKYVTIDGSNTVNGTTRDLIISNTSTTGSTIRFTNVAANSTIKNAVLTGVTTSTSNAVVLIGSSVTTANTNITVQNNTITKGATLPAYGVLNSGSSALANTNVLITGNSISDFSLVGVMDAGNSNGMTVTKNNIFGTVTQTTSSSLTGIVLGANTVVSPVITGNKIYDLKTGNTSTNTSTLTGVLTGIDIFDIASGTTALIANNMISLYGTGAAPGVRIVGIADESTVGTSNIYYNSVSINGTGTAASSFAFLKNYNNTTNLRNNILSNTRVSSGTSGQYAIANTNTGTFSSNYNDLYSSGNSLNVVGSFGSTNYATLPLWQAASGGDANSISADPSFTSANDLHVSGSSPVNAAATPIAGITTDIDGDTRNATTPDIGADEFTPTNNDAGITDFPGAYCPGSPANVTVTLKNFGLTNLTSATINWSVNGVPQTPYTWAGTLAPGATANVIVGTYTFNGSTVYTLTGVTSLPNGVPDEGPSNDNYTATNVRTSLSGTYTVGTAGDFTTLTAAVAAANNYGLCGPTTFNLTNANYTAASGETFPITINQLTGASAVNTLTIKPNTGVSPVISGSNEVILKLNGADYITIDGSNTVGGSTRNLTVQNTSTSTTSNVIWIASVNSTNGALNNTIKNSIVKGSGYQNTSTGIITSGSTAGTAAESGNDNTSIVNNLIQATAGGISVIGKTTTMDQNVLIKDNNLGSTVTADKMGFIAMQIVNQANGLITGNSIIGLSTTATTYAGAGIDLFGMHSNMIIEKNVIGDIKNTNSTGFGVVGILLESDNTAANITVRNNFVYNVAAIGYTDRTETDNGYGIGIVLGGGYKIYNNTVSLDASQSATGYPSCLLVTDGVTTVGSIDLRNNIFTNTQTQSGQRYAIQSTANSNVFSDINYNDYYTVGNNLGYIGSNRANLAAIQTGFGKNVNSVNILPTFISATNLHIDPSAAGNVALNNLGTPIADVTTDIDADLRNELTPDMGADEFDPCSATMLTWTGKISTDWNVGGNWCSGAVPTAANSVVIPAGVPSHNYPVLGTTGAANNVTINTSVNDVIIAPAGILSVAGNFVNNGKMTNNGTIRLNGTALQTFPGPGLIGTVGDMANLEIANTGAGVKVTKAFGITNELKPTSGALDLDAYDVTIRSTFAATAHVAEVMPAASFLYSGTGRFVVERFINTGNTAGTHKRTWQFLSVPTTTAPASTAQTIKSAWQEGAATPGDNPVAGFGTRLSSPRFVAAGAPNGFDEGLATAGPGIKTYRGDVDDWDQGPNSTNEAIANPKGWMVFVRGDRTVSGSTAPTAPTTLRTRGALITGTQTDVISINSDKYGSVGNPYASSIDLTKVDTLNVTNEVYIWDPTLGDGYYGFGRFRTLTKVGNHYEAVPYGGAYPAGINDTIQSGQAFFYKARTGATATIGFKETAKLSGSKLVNRGGAEGELLTVTLSSLLYPDAPILLDGAAAIFGDFSGKVDSDDGLKIANSNENIGFRRSGSLLAVERRPEPVANDTLHLDFNSAKQQSYNWKIAPRKIDAPGRTAWLVDKFLNTTSSISLTDTSSFDFVVNNNAASYAADRFKIVFKVNVVLPVTITSISAVRNPDRSIKVRWSVENELNIDKYEVERSADGIRFSGIITNAATNSRTYAKDDLSPLSQDNYYRIKATSNNGQVQYSAIVKVAPLKTDGLISVYPNPVEGKIINLRFTDMTEGSYQLQLTNKLGQVVYSGTANVTAATFVKNITLSKVVTAGTYQMKVIDAGGRAVNIQVVVQ